MRIFERLTYVFAVGLAIAYGFEAFIASFVLLCLTAFSFIIGAGVEGLRFPQWFFAVAFVSQIVLVVLEVFSYIALAIYCSFLLFAILSSLIWGENNMSTVYMVGPYEVGHKDFHTSVEGIACSAYYPMDKEEYIKNIHKKDRNTPWLRYGYKSRLGVTKATAQWGSDYHVDPWMYKYLDDVYMYTCQDGEVAADFKTQEEPATEKRKLIPLVFLHGLSCNRTASSGLCRDFASHGYIVFSMDHCDGSSYYSQKKNGDEFMWKAQGDFTEKRLYVDRLAVRKREVTDLIDDLFKPGFLQTTLGFPEGVELDLDKLIVGGHSFGGCTAIHVANKDPRVKVLYGLDPWLWPIREDLDNGSVHLQIPQHHIITDEFEKRCREYFQYSTSSYTKKMIKKSGHDKQGEVIMLLGSNHYYQTDALIIVHVETAMACCEPIRFDAPQYYLSNSQAILLWLDSVGHSNNQFAIGPVQEFVKSREHTLQWKLGPNGQHLDSQETEVNGTQAAADLEKGNIGKSTKEGGQREYREVNVNAKPAFNPNEFYSEIIDSESYDIVGENPVTESALNSQADDREPLLSNS